jgi:hypothetical protein
MEKIVLRILKDYSNEKSMKRHFCCLIFLFISLTSKAQEAPFWNNYRVEMSSFYYWNSVNSFVGVYYDELTFSPGFSVNITNRLHLGVRSFIVRGRSLISPAFSKWHVMMGPNLMFNVFKKESVELNVEAGYYFGNYCPNCTPANEFYDSSLNYIGLDFQLNWQFINPLPQLWFKFSFSTNNVVGNKLLNGYNLPLFGVQYRFGRVE